MTVRETPGDRSIGDAEYAVHQSEIQDVVSGWESTDPPIDLWASIGNGLRRNKPSNHGRKGR